MRAQSPGLLRVVSANGFILSALYLLVGLGVECLRRWYPSYSVLRLSLALDSLPARALHGLGLLLRMQEAYGEGRMREWMLRLIFGATTVLLIFVLALLLGAVLWVFQRGTPRPRPPRVGPRS